MAGLSDLFGNLTDTSWMSGITGGDTGGGSFSQSPIDYGSLFGGGNSGIPGIDYSTGGTFNNSGSSGGLGSAIGSGLSSLLGGAGNLLGSNLIGGLTTGGALNAGLAYKNSQDASQKLTDLSNLAMQRADPFAPQRAQYQGQLQQLMSNPEQYLGKFTQGAYDLASQAAERSNAASGSFSSSKTSSDLMDLATKMMSGNALNFGNLLGNLSGANIQPGFGIGASTQAASQGITTGAEGLNNLTSALAQASKPAQTVVNVGGGGGGGGSSSGGGGGGFGGIIGDAISSIGSFLGF
jgi:hypothetical protein